MITMKELEAPVRQWVPDWLGLISIFVVILPVTMLNGSYTGSMLEVSNTLGTNSEDITMGYYAASAGMAIAYPIIPKVLAAFSVKSLLLIDLILQFFLSWVCARTQNADILIVRDGLGLNDLGRQHIGGQRCLQCLPHGLLLRLSTYIDQNQLIRRLVVQAHGHIHPRLGRGSRLNLAQFDPVAHVLNLEVSAGEINQLAPFIPPHQIAGFIHPLRIVTLQRILHKGSRRFVRVVIVAHNQERTSGVQFALLADSGQPPVLGNHKAVAIVTGNTDGHALHVFDLPIHNVVGANIRGFRRAKQVGKQGVRILAAPVIQLLGRHDLTGKQHLFNMLRHHKVQHL